MAPLVSSTDSKGFDKAEIIRLRGRQSTLLDESGGGFGTREREWASAFVRPGDISVQERSSDTVEARRDAHTLSKSRLVVLDVR
jgi:hypothetical protein